MLFFHAFDAYVLCFKYDLVEKEVFIVEYYFFLSSFFFFFMLLAKLKDTVSSRHGHMVISDLYFPVAFGLMHRKAEP